MRFDWYQATIPEDPMVLLGAFRELAGRGGEVEQGAGRHNYKESFTVRNVDGERVAVVLSGGANGNPNATASGAFTDQFVNLVRERWPVHRVTRFDAAEDFCAPGSYNELEGVCRGVAMSLGVKGRAIVPDDVTEGRTYYMGSVSSDVRVRLYDKTAESRRFLPAERHAEIPENWSRLEAQVRPRKEWKAYAAQATPEQAWGFSGWTTTLADKAMSLSLERITMQANRESDDQRAYRYLLIQYGPLLQRLAEGQGSWEMVGRTIGDDLRRIAKQKQTGGM